MRTLTKASLITLVALLVTACTTVNYESPHFAEETVSHRSIAVLPFEVIRTGKLPARLDPVAIATIEEQDSLAFQTALYHSLLNRSSVHRKHPILVRIQPVEITNSILIDNGIGIRETWSMEAAELADILGVDAVVQTAVHTTRYLSDGESFGLDVGMAVLDHATEGRFAWLLPFGLTTTHTIWADSSLIDGANGGVLWKIAVERATDWSRPPESIIVGITRKLARRFPYRA